MEVANFDTWLSDRFRELNTDEDVFVPYIKSIVEGDETTEEKIDALDGILAELAADGNLVVETFRKEIMSRWEQHLKTGGNDAAANGTGVSGAELQSKFEKLLELNDNVAGSSSTRQENKSLAAADSALRAAILSQCQDSSDNESDDEAPTGSGGGGGGGGGCGGAMERNTNVERVQNDLKANREREKADAAKKREKDKEDRAKQKQQIQDRKDKAKKKTAKVERKAR